MAKRITRPPVRLLLVGFWIVPAIIATVGFGVVPSRYNPELGLPGVLAAQLLIWLAWGGWSLLIIAVGDRYPLERGTWWKAVLAHIPLCVIVVCAQIVVISVVSDVFGLSGRTTQLSHGLTQWAGIAPPSDPEMFLYVNSVLALGVRQFADMLVMVYAAVVGTHAGLRWNENWRRAQLQAAQLSEDLAHAQLQALRAQLNPHFLFNALNAIVTLVKRDPEAAERTTLHLADLLRATLTAGDSATITLGQELELTRRYLEIEQVRFPDRLRVVWQVDETLLSLPIPPFVLQPLVENAVRHAVSPNPLGGTITLTIATAAHDLLLTVRDEGPGAEGATRLSKGTGTALNNLRTRLQRAYGNNATLVLQTRDGGGTEAAVRIPGVVRG